MAKKSSSPAKLILNRRARFDYDIREKLWAGIVLSGIEVRAVRDGRASLRSAYATIKDGELWLTNASFTVQQGSLTEKTVDTRPRKLLIKKRQLAQLIAAKNQGLTLIPLSMTTNTRYIKIEIATAKGKKSYDKRETIRRRDTERDTKRLIKRTRGT